MSTAEWIAGIIIGLGTAVINKIWNKKAASLEQAKTDLLSQCETAIATARSVMTQIILTARPGATTEWVVQQCKGAVAIQIAKLRTAVADKPWAILLIDSPAVQTLIDKAITDAVKTFVEIHTNPYAWTSTPDGPRSVAPDERLAPPVLKKIAALEAAPSGPAASFPTVRATPGSLA